MNNICQKHQLPLQFQCKLNQCNKQLGCQQCFIAPNSQHHRHQYEQVLVPSQFLPYPQQNQQNQFASNNPQLQKALSIFDEQFEKSLQDLLSSVNQTRFDMRAQYEQFLQNVSPDELAIYTIGNPVPPITEYFEIINSSIQKSYPEPNIVEPSNEITFEPYLQKYGIPEFIKIQLSKFVFDRKEFENPSINFLTEEDRQNSLIIGQKDPQTQMFNGRAMIIYKYEKAAIYLGYLKDNMRHGRGILVIDDFKYYLGEFFNNLEWGFGEVQTINNNQLNEKYVGYFSQGKKCGCGEQMLLNPSSSNPQLHSPLVEYFNNIPHGPSINYKNEFELNQYGESYFEKAYNGQEKKNIQVNTMQISESKHLGFLHNIQVDSMFNQSQYQLHILQMNNNPNNAQFQGNQQAKQNQPQLYQEFKNQTLKGVQGFGNISDQQQQQQQQQQYFSAQQQFNPNYPSYPSQEQLFGNQIPSDIDQNHPYIIPFKSTIKHIIYDQNQK